MNQLLDQGKIEIQGSPEILARSGVDFAKLVGTVEKDDEKEDSPDKSLSRQTSSRSSTGSLSSLKSSNDGSVVEKDEGVQMEASSKGKVKGSIAGNYFAAGTHWSILVILGISFIIVQLLASGADYWVSIW